MFDAVAAVAAATCSAGRIKLRAVTLAPSARRCCPTMPTLAEAGVRVTA